jgi:hypothetical protein
MTMNLSKVFEKIESVRFAIDFTVISGFNIFQIALEENKTLRQLVSALKRKPGHKDRVLERLIALLQADHAREFQHPNDVALAAYLFVLYKADTAMAYSVAEMLLGYQNLWWARRLAEHIVGTTKTVSTQFSAQIGQIPAHLNAFVFAESIGEPTAIIPMEVAMHKLPITFRFASDVLTGTVVQLGQAILVTVFSEVAQSLNLNVEEVRVP